MHLLPVDNNSAISNSHITSFLGSFKMISKGLELKFETVPTCYEQLPENIVATAGATGYPTRPVRNGSRFLASKRATNLLTLDGRV